LVVGLDTSPPVAWVSDDYPLDCEEPLKSSQPGEDAGEDDGAAVGEGVLVVAGGDAAPLLEDVDTALDPGPALVLDGVVGDRSAAA
jgi:hypothetical protein